LVGVHYESLVIGSVRAEGVSGCEALGATELRFSLAWNLAANVGEPIFVFGTRIWVSVGFAGEERRWPLGRAEPESAWCDQTRNGHAFERRVLYRLTSPLAQVLALEELTRVHTGRARQQRRPAWGARVR
jgi:hypothetical protein